MTSILFVCTGNICRSPMASALFKSKLGRKSAHRGWTVDSAGTWASEGSPASPNAQEVLQGWGLDITNHRSKPVSPELILAADLVLTMERDHRDHLKTLYPERSDRIHMLSEMIGREDDIDDPIGKSVSDYETTARELDRILNEGLRKILRLAEQRKG